MNNLGYEVLNKLDVLADYKAAIEAKSDRNQEAVNACNRALEEASGLVRRIQTDPESINRRLADLDLLLNDLFDNNVELQKRLGIHRGTATIAPDKPETKERREDPLPEIENVLIKAGHPPQGTISSITVDRNQKPQNGDKHND